MTGAEAMREATRRYRAGESMAGLFADDCVIGGNPGGVMPPSEGSTVDQKIGASSEQGVGYALREIIAERGGRAAFSAVWTHGEDETRGSAGLFFGVVAVEHGLITRLDLFPTRDEALAALGRG